MHASGHESCPSARRPPNGLLSGPSLGRPRLLDSGQGRPTTTTKRTTPPPLTSKNPAHQDPRQDPGQEEVTGIDQPPTCVTAGRGLVAVLGPFLGCRQPSPRGPRRRSRSHVALCDDAQKMTGPGEGPGT